MPVTVWHGSDADLRRLQASVGANCDCQPSRGDTPPTTCAAHRMLTDQYVLDHVDFFRHIRANLRLEEWLVHVIR